MHSTDTLALKEKTYYITEKNKGYYNDFTVLFFSELLEFINVVRHAYDRGSRRFLLLRTEKSRHEIDIESSHISEVLTDTFLSFYQNEALTKIYIEEKQSKSLINEYTKNDKVGKITFNNKAEDEVQELDEILRSLDDTFLEEKEKELLQEKINRLQSLYQVENNRLFKKKQILSYLNHYYEILSTILCSDDLLEAEGITEHIIIPLLNLGIEWTDENKGRVKMTSPIVLSSMYNIYDKLNEYLLMYNENSEEEKQPVAAFEECIEHEIFIDKIRQMNRFYVIREQRGELYYATLLPYVQEKKEESLGLNVRKLSTFNSYQGIRELRLAEKILFEIKCLSSLSKEKLQGTTDNIYRIVLMGDIYEQPMRQLIAYIESSIRQDNKEYCSFLNQNKSSQSVHIEFVVYTRNIKKNQIIYGDMCTCEFKLYDDQLTNVKKLDEILKSGHLFFFLDNCQLYEMGVKPIYDMLIFRQRVTGESYEEYCLGSGTEDLTLNYKLMEMYNAMTTYAWQGRLGYFEKKAKESLIKYIRSRINESVGKTAYVYISDMDAFKSLYCVQSQIVRIEKYSQKKIGIIRFSAQEKTNVPVTYVLKNEHVSKVQPTKMLVCNMWQFVKHNALNQEGQFQKWLFPNAKPQFLNKIYIGMDYTQWKKEIVLDYYYEDKKLIDEVWMKQFMEYLVKKLQPVENPDMYCEYIKKSFVSFLYGCAKSVEDLIFLHIFKSKDKQIGKLKLKQEMNEVKQKTHHTANFSELELYYNLNCKYSYKKNYWEASEKLDGTCSAYDRYAIKNEIENDWEFINHTMNRKPSEQFLMNILEACENIEYTDSKLYQTCLDEIYGTRGKNYGQRYKRTI